MSYPERLEKTKTTYFSLSARMTWGDTIQVFKEINAVNKEINPVISLNTMRSSRAQSKDSQTSSSSFIILINFKIEGVCQCKGACQSVILIY